MIILSDYDDIYSVFVVDDGHDYVDDYYQLLFLLTFLSCNCANISDHILIVTTVPSTIMIT